MKAAVLKNWLDPELCDVPKPIPNENGALIKVKPAGACGRGSVHHRLPEISAFPANRKKKHAQTQPPEDLVKQGYQILRGPFLCLI